MILSADEEGESRLPDVRAHSEQHASSSSSLDGANIHRTRANQRPGRSSVGSLKRATSIRLAALALAISTILIAAASQAVDAEQPRAAAAVAARHERRAASISTLGKDSMLGGAANGGEADDDDGGADEEQLAANTKRVNFDELPPEEQSHPAAGSNELAAENGNHLINQAPAASRAAESSSSRLRIVRLFSAPEAVQNGTQNVTIDCMFKFDKKLDQRLTIKWFFNDELEPIYQWIPELNKRVYSDRYERFLDKSYEVGEDIDFMLQAYRWMQLSSPASSVADSLVSLPRGSAAAAEGEANNNDAADEDNDADQDDQGGGQESGGHSAAAAATAATGQRKLLANRLNRLAKLGGQQSGRLLDSLRAALEMDPKWSAYTRFRALRLIRPTTQLNGRFTCSVSSLEGDDLASKQLVVFEPAKSFTFTVNRVPNSPNQFNLTCQAGQVFPRPTLALFRYRAGPPASAAATPTSAAHRKQQQQQQPPHPNQQRAARPRLAAASLRQEPIADTRTHLTLSHAMRDPAASAPPPPDSNDIHQEGDDQSSHPTQSQQHGLYEISSWALVDEASLSSYVVTQFECLLSIEGLTGQQHQRPHHQEQRLSLALQKGWHVNSAALTSRTTLVGLFSALASLLCLMLAMASSMLIFKLLKRHAKNRIHDQDKTSDCSAEQHATVVARTTSASSAHSSR